VTVIEEKGAENIIGNFFQAIINFFKWLFSLLKIS
jgi:hypothetical protein